ncbi:ferredoxin-type protein NapF [Sulfurimonas sp. HSL-1716]|uniref:ferredoxin-type protein NapF n=1 Tax=Hydrocurvibacter sulfurireducens TaxID=3131937 RepID=UPI0031FA2B93
MNRRELFSSLTSSIKKKKESYIRPPYYEDESLFYSECEKCDGKCATVCKEEIIKIAGDKTPYIDFSKNGCTYCDECAHSCEYGVLVLENKKNINAKVVINKKKCYSWSGIMCFTCKDPCLDNAIDFQAMFMPVIDDSKCTACGFCINVCPAASIDIKVIE